MKNLFINLIKNNQVSHAYFIEGVGGENFSLWAASKLLCGCNTDECITCRRIYNNNHPDVIIIRPEGINVKVDQIRQLQQSAALKSVENRGQVFIILGADKMKDQASNALLKFLEEPKPGVTLFLLGNNKDALIPTIRSRVQVLKLEHTNDLVKSANERGIHFSSLSLFEEINASLDQVEKYADVADSWVELIRTTLNTTRLTAITQLPKWETTFPERDMRELSIKLIQSYVKGLVAQARGTYHLWGDIPHKPWEELVEWHNAVHDLTKSFHSNGGYKLQLNIFIQRVMTANLVIN